MEQEHLVSEDFSPVYFYHREIQGSKLDKWTLRGESEVRNVLEVIDGLDRQAGTMSIDDLDLNANPEMFVEALLDGYPDHREEFCSSLLNDFSDSMHTRAREEGKYAILILTEGSVLICHTDSEELTITKDADVIERLLDADNVDKYARFRRADGGIEVLNFERNRRSKSFSDWLGLQPEEVVYEDAGDIKVFTEVDGSTCVFEFEREEFAKKFLIDGTCELLPGTLRMPGERYPVHHIKIGRRKFDTVDEFLQEFFSLYYDLKHYDAEYATLVNSMEPYTTTIVDHNDKVTIGGPRGETRLVKRNGEFNILFADRDIDLSAKWRLKLSKRFSNGTQTRIYHPGLDFSEEPVRIGPFEIHNRLDVDAERLHQLHGVTQKAETGEYFSNVLHCVTFDLLSNQCSDSLQGFFKQMRDTYQDNLHADGLVLRDEDNVLEYKSRDWVVGKDEDETAEAITREIQAETRLLFIGIEEEEQRIRPLSRNKFHSDRNQRVLKKIRQQNGHHKSVEMSSLQLGNGDILLYVYAAREDDDVEFVLP
ncbi:hypothetical protein NDI85_09530 [Halomicroarcula sp. S1AR25-4]|uniref:hypothetical protein n=1 Tax=Haloarcula sp. S1AR25-4 TaxID=2950538 RepID=UPI002875D5EA|nr:hypothetical protein [Halomicroarcula sp. S1AR25-4]MDS0278035.1 hypothetical protein [Halomicroarcula sp. S1AR25-4]